MTDIYDIFGNFWFFTPSALTLWAIAGSVGLFILFFLGEILYKKRKELKARLRAKYLYRKYTWELFWSLSPDSPDFVDRIHFFLRKVLEDLDLHPRALRKTFTELKPFIKDVRILEVENLIAEVKYTPQKADIQTKKHIHTLVRSILEIYNEK